MRRRSFREILGVAVSVGVVVSVGGMLAGCGGLEPVGRFTPTTDPTQLYMSLALNHRAITLDTLAPYNTLQLMATPLDATGAPIPDLPAPVFTSKDTTTVWVTPGGQLQARRAGTGITVIASLTAPGNIRHADTAIVNITASSGPPPVLASLTLSSIPADSAKIQYCPGGAFQFVDVAIRLLPFKACELDVAVTAQAAGGADMPGLAIEY